jgi:hypothetical protein
VVGFDVDGEGVVAVIFTANTRMHVDNAE